MKSFNKAPFYARSLYILLVSIPYCGSWILTILGISCTGYVNLVKYITIALPTEIIFSMVFSTLILKRKFEMTNLMACFLLAGGAVFANVFEFSTIDDIKVFGI
jgi:drug/metabolite transporter (DMT)-like permease